MLRSALRRRPSPAQAVTVQSSFQEPKRRARGQLDETIGGHAAVVSGKRSRVQVELTAVGSPSGIRDCAVPWYTSSSRYDVCARPRAEPEADLDAVRISDQSASD